jgi:opacity protein-like surface antigen
MPQEMTMSDPYSWRPDTNAELDDGIMVGFKVGWNTPFTRNIMALEMEYNYITGTDFDRNQVVNAFGEGPGRMDGNLDIHAFLFNIKARYPEGRFHPYIGVGIGYAYFDVGDIRVADPYGTYFVPDNSGGGFCYQFMAGMELDLTPHLSLGIGYKYFRAKPEIDEDDYWGDDDYWKPNYDLEYKTSMITMGLTFTF